MSSDFSEYEPLGEATVQILSLSEEERIRVKGLSRWLPKLITYHVLSVLLLGIPYLISRWYPTIRLLKYRICSLRNAELVCLEDVYGNCDIIKLDEDNLNLPHAGQIYVRSFYYKHTKYVWLPQSHEFGNLDSLFPGHTGEEYLDDTAGLSDFNHQNLMKLYSLNKIEIIIKSYWKLFVDEILNPFYFFQVFAVILWFTDYYVIYAGVIVGLSLFSILSALLQTRKQRVTLRNTVESSKCRQVQVVKRRGEEDVIIEIDPVKLVPGDLIILPKADFMLPCDIVLLTGQCIVNESMLTGESVPITKTSIQPNSELYTVSGQRRHTLFCGTHMIQSRNIGGEHVLGRIVKTGFETSKGSLIKSILFPTPMGLQFYKDSLKFIFVLFIIATAGTSYSLYLYIMRKATWGQIVIRSLDIITIVVPPALPAAMTVGIVYSQRRLEKLNIFCISPQRINVSGKINLACFDKTGTLTQDGLDMHSVIPAVNGEFADSIFNTNDLSVDNKLVQGMAACHSLTYVNGALIGDPLDLSMFEFAKWELEELGETETARYEMLVPAIVKPSQKCIKVEESAGDNHEISCQVGIIRQFPFSSNLQCMSVICRDLSRPTMMVFTKGAPEKVSGMCRPETLPPDFPYKLKHYAVQGFRIIALAYREMPRNFRWKESQKAKRETVECELVFLGLLVMQNTLKPETTPVMRVLRSANIRNVMITGDNILTAISVARECEMINTQDQVLILEIKDEDSNTIPNISLQSIGTAGEGDATISRSDVCHFAIDGKTWSKLKMFYSDKLPDILVRTTVFARFQPDQKTQVIKALQSLDYVVSMVGDGANDCGALKAAHVGVSLSAAEASVAAPFTSQVENISCLVHIILEGRCALVTSFGLIKYMALYSLIQLFSVLLLYRNRSLMGDMEFLYIDLIVTTTLAVTIGRQGPARVLTKKRPMGSLVSLRNLIPLALQIICCGLVQFAALAYLSRQEWFVPVPSDVKEAVVLCWENTVLFTVSSFQYVVLAMVYSKGRPYRKMIITNFWFLLSALSLTIFNVYLMICPSKVVAEYFELMFLPKWTHAQRNFRYQLLVLPLVHLFISVFIEIGIAERDWFRYILKSFRRKAMKKYKSLLSHSDIMQYLLESSSDSIQ